MDEIQTEHEFMIEPVELTSGGTKPETHLLPK